MKFIGIDWAHETHQIWVSDSNGERVAEKQVGTSPPEIEGFLEWLEEIAPSKEGRFIGIESGALYLTERLLDEGHTVYVFNPKVVDRYRDRYSSAGSKDDRFDARVMANMVRWERLELWDIRQPVESLR